MSDALEFTTTDAPSADEVAALIAGLLEHRRGRGPDVDMKPIGVFVRRDGRIVAGADGQTAWNWLYVAHVWVDESLRGSGLGAQVLAAIEDAARSRGCHGVYLDTFSFQAAPFYEKLGYREFGRLDDFAGETKHFLWKEL